MQNTSSGLTANNNIKLLFDGDSALTAIKEALNSAKHSINIEYFLFSDDKTGTGIKDILTERARNGVKVRVLLDAVGSWRLGRKFMNSLRDSGVDVRKFFGTGITHRDHRKIITVDGRTGLLGGFNIGDTYLQQWRDTHIVIAGEAVNVLEGMFAEMWQKSGGGVCIPESSEDGDTHIKSAGVMDGIFSEMRQALYIPENPKDDCGGNIPVKIIASGTGKDFRAVADEYIRVISCAKCRVWITTPYLVPDKKFLDTLYDASRRGVDVRIIIPLNSNHIFASWASQYYVDGMLEHGVRIFTYSDKFIHAKTLIADSNIASVGTANLDALSFETNYEVQAFMYSEKIAGELEQVFMRDIQQCTEENIQDRKHRPFTRKLQERAGRLLSRFL